MKLESLSVHSLEIPFTTTFRHALAERAATQTVWVQASACDGATGYGEGCPREYVTGENLESAARFYAAHRRDWLSIGSLPDLREWVESHSREIDRNPAAWCAVELALLDVLGRSAGKSIESLLGLPELQGSFRYSAVLGDAEPGAFRKQLRHYRDAGFADFKVKLSSDADRDAAKVRALREAGVPPAAVRADANNLWASADAALDHLSKLGFNFRALEEPLQAGDLDGMARLAVTLGTKIVLDESLLRRDQLSGLDSRGDRWIANLRVSKMGGLLRSLDLLPALRERGLGLIVGAQVGETSVLTRAALTFASAGRDLLVAQEGAFGTHLLARDVARPALMFGRGGLLEASDASLVPAGSGLGVCVEPSDLRALLPGRE